MSQNDREKSEADRLEERMKRRGRKPSEDEVSEFAEKRVEEAVPQIREALGSVKEIQPALEALNKALDEDDHGHIKTLLWQIDQSGPIKTIRDVWNRLPTFVQKILYWMNTMPMGGPVPMPPVCKMLVEAGFLDIDGFDKGKTTESNISLSAGIQKIVVKVVMLLEPELKILAPLILVCDKLSKKEGEYRVWLREERIKEDAKNKEKDSHGKNHQGKGGEERLAA